QLGEDAAGQVAVFGPPRFDQGDHSAQGAPLPVADAHDIFVRGQPPAGWGSRRRSGRCSHVASHVTPAGFSTARPSRMFINRGAAWVMPVPGPRTATAPLWKSAS